MARTPAQSIEEARAAAEAAYGARTLTISAHARITAATRGPIRAWLTAHGVPSEVARAASLATLRNAWTDTSNATLNALRATTPEKPAMPPQDLPWAQALATRGDRSAPPTIDHEPAAPAPVRTVAGPVAPGPTFRLAQALAEAMAAQPAHLDADAVRAIVAEELAAAPPAGISADDARAIVAEAVANAHKPLTIAIRAVDGTVRTLSGISHPQMPDLLTAAQAIRGKGGMGIWLAGPTGSGKTHAARQVAEALALPFHHNGALADPYALLGYQDAGGTYHGTAFRRAYEHGGIYCFDEVDASDNAALLALNGALANGSCTFPDQAIDMHADFVCIATANTWGGGGTSDFVGRSRVDAAFLSRFPVRFAWRYDDATERALAGNDAWCDRVQKARRRADAAGLKVIIDPRTTYAGAALIAAGMAPDAAAAFTYLASLTDDQRRTVEG